MTPNLLSLLAYIGPEVTLPLASGLAALLGIVLMFWHYTWAAFKKVFRVLFRKKTEPATTSATRTSAAPELAAPNGQAVGQTHRTGASL